jgi:hypothetical protein
MKLAACRKAISDMYKIWWKNSEWKINLLMVEKYIVSRVLN